MDDILIERLVLDMPGLTKEQAAELAEHVGKGLAEAKPGPGKFETLTVDLNERAGSMNIPRLANAIVDSLIQQIG